MEYVKLPPAVAKATTLLWTFLAIMILANIINADPSIFQVRDFVTTSNRLRANHGAPPFSVNQTLMQYAQDYANQVAATDNLDSSHGPYGENLYWTQNEIDTRHAVEDKWYAQSSSYDFSNGGFSPKTGAFTQLVWKDTTDVGLGIARSDASGKSYMVASYWPQGNQDGDYQRNVLPPGSTSFGNGKNSGQSRPKPVSTERQQDVDNADEAPSNPVDQETDKSGPDSDSVPSQNNNNNNGPWGNNNNNNNEDVPRFQKNQPPPQQQSQPQPLSQQQSQPQPNENVNQRYEALHRHQPITGLRQLNLEEASG